MTRDIASAKHADMRASFAALKRAAAHARQIAIQTNTAIVVVRAGKVVRVPAAELREEQALQAS